MSARISRRMKSKVQIFCSKNCVKYCRRLSIIANLITTGVGVTAIAFGVNSGFSNGTISFTKNYLNVSYFGPVPKGTFDDLLLTTPITLFIFYGILFTVLGVIGLSSNFFMSEESNIGSYLQILGSVLILYHDSTNGVLVFWDKNPVNNWINVMNKSMEYYGSKESGDDFGIGLPFPLSATVYWDHIQRIGNCCGLDGWIDWKSKPFGGSGAGDIPDSCCQPFRDRPNCGALLWVHSKFGYPEDIKEKGCRSIFPVELIQDFPVVFGKWVTLVKYSIMGNILVLVISIIAKLTCWNCDSYLPNQVRPILCPEQKRVVVRLPLPAKDLNFKINENVISVSSFWQETNKL